MSTPILRPLAVFFGLACATPLAAQEAVWPISAFAPGSPVQGTLSLTEAEFRDGRCHLSGIVRAPALWSDLDALARARGNMGSNEARLYWVGPTHARDVAADGSTLLSTRVRFESWAHIKVLFDTVKTKLFQDTKTVEFRVTPRWDGNANRLTLDYALVNIRNFPGEFERLAADLGAQFAGRHTVDLPDTPQTRALDPRIDSGPDFSAHGNGLQVVMTVSVNQNWGACQLARLAADAPDTSRKLLDAFLGL